MNVEDKINFEEVRKEYENAGIDIDDLDEHPMSMFENWYADATKVVPGRWYEPNAMALATSDSSGRVSVRYVLLKGVSAEGIKFYSNYDSDKAIQLSENPQCSVVFHWPYLGRQIRIEGTAEKTSRQDSEKYFHSRPRGSQIGAAISNQSETIESREILEQKKESLVAELGNSTVPLPDNWGGYLIRPTRLEFWQGRLDRLHDRLVYSREDLSSPWKISRLSP